MIGSQALTRSEKLVLAIKAHVIFNAKWLQEQELG